MHNLSKLFILISILFILFNTATCTTSSVPTSKIQNEREVLLGVTPAVKHYAFNTVKPVVDAYPNRDKLSLLLKVCDVISDKESGINKYSINPSDYIVYDILDKIKLGFIVTYGLSSEQKYNLKDWHERYMLHNPADVFFAPSASEVIKKRAAFGCSHYARAFMAVVKSLGLIDQPENLRYAISCVAADYNKAYEKLDNKMTINGHQFVIANVNSKWIAINTSKSEWVAMPESFSPDLVQPPQNIPIQFPSYPNVTFLLRKIGKDYNDDCRDSSLKRLMNIYRSGNIDNSSLNWDKFIAK